MRLLLHVCLMHVIRMILKDDDVPNVPLVVEARGPRSLDSSRPGNVVALDFFADGRHLVIDEVMTNVYRNTVLIR
jgi:hypothetical protein